MPLQAKCKTKPDSAPLHKRANKYLYARLIEFQTANQIWRLHSRFYWFSLNIWTWPVRMALNFCLIGFALSERKLPFIFHFLTLYDMTWYTYSKSMACPNPFGSDILLVERNFRNKVFNLHSCIARSLIRRE